LIDLLTLKNQSFFFESPSIPKALNQEIKLSFEGLNLQNLNMTLKTYKDKFSLEIKQEFLVNMTSEVIEFSVYLDDGLDKINYQSSLVFVKDLPLVKEKSILTKPVVNNLKLNAQEERIARRNIEENKLKKIPEPILDISPISSTGNFSMKFN
jgi:hypothetical protein